MIQHIEKNQSEAEAGAALTVAISMITSARVQFDGFGVRETQGRISKQKKSGMFIQESSIFFLQN